MSNDTIWIDSVVSARDYRPFVQLKWGVEGCQMTPDEARAHAYAILNAANAAETDAMMVGFLRDKVGLKEGVDIAVILKDFRELRDKTKYVIRDGQNRTKL